MARTERLILCFSLQIFVTAWQAAARADEIDHLASLRDCAVSNAECWKQYDVLIKYQFFTTSSKRENAKEDSSRLSEGCRTIRLAIDFEKNSCFCFELMESGPTKKTIARANLMNDGVAYSRSFPGGTNGIEGKKMPLLSILSNASVPDLRCVALKEFPADFSPQENIGFGSVRQHRNRTNRAPDSLNKSLTQLVSEKDGKIQLAIYRPGAQFGFFFDSNSLMPDRSIASRVVDGNLLPEMEEDYSWKEMSGVYVPIQFLRETTSFEKGNLVSSVAYETVQMHWFSLNEPIDKNLLDPVLSNDLSKLRKLADPKLLGIDGMD